MEYLDLLSIYDCVKIARYISNLINPIYEVGQGLTLACDLISQANEINKYCKKTIPILIFITINKNKNWDSFFIFSSSSR